MERCQPASSSFLQFCHKHKTAVECFSTGNFQGMFCQLPFSFWVSQTEVHMSWNSLQVQCSWKCQFLLYCRFLCLYEPHPPKVPVQFLWTLPLNPALPLNSSYCHNGLLEQRIAQNRRHPQLTLWRVQMSTESGVCSSVPSFHSPACLHCQCTGESLKPTLQCLPYMEKVQLWDYSLPEQSSQWGEGVQCQVS